MQRAAAELALSCLHHCSNLTPNDIRNALIQCRDYSLPMLEKACNAVELSALETGRDGPIPEALFETAKQWEWLYRMSAENEQPINAQNQQQNNLNAPTQHSFQPLDQPQFDAQAAPAHANQVVNFGVPLNHLGLDFQFQNLHLQGQMAPPVGGQAAPPTPPFYQLQQQMLRNGHNLAPAQNVQHHPPAAQPVNPMPPGLTLNPTHARTTPTHFFQCPDSWRRRRA